MCTSTSATFVKLSDTSAGTAAFLRCAIALVVLVPMAAVESRRLRRGGRPAMPWAPVGAGAMLGIDYVLCAASIHTVGAAIATVLVNIQVVVFPLLARAFLGAALSRSFWVAAPAMLIGVGLAGGLLGASEPGSDPLRGVVYGVLAGLAYAGYQFLMHVGATGSGATMSVCVSTAAACAASAVVGALWTGIDVAPGWTAFGYLTALALIGRVVAWLLIAAAMPRLTPTVSASLLILHPVPAVLLGFAIGERPTLTQLGGCAVVITVVWLVGRGRGPEPATSEQVPEGEPHAARRT